MEQHLEDHNVNGNTQYFYPQDQDPAYIGYPGALGYAQMPHAPRNQQMVDGSMHASYLGNLSLQQQTTHYQTGVFETSAPHGSLPLANSPPPPSPEMYDPLSPPLSGSDTSGDGAYHHSNSSGANSPSSSRSHSLVHRTHRYNPTPSPTSSSRRRSRSQDSDEEEMGLAIVENLANSRKEATRRQRIEAEQRRRDELRDGYAKLKDALPSTNSKSSKVTLLERATNHIIALERENKELLQRIAILEAESQKLRAQNEKIVFKTEDTPSPDHPMGRPISPPPDAAPIGPAVVSSKGQQPSKNPSPSTSASDGGH